MIHTVRKHVITGHRCEPSPEGGWMEGDSTAVLQQGLQRDVGGVQKNTDERGGA